MSDPIYSAQIEAASQNRIQKRVIQLAIVGLVTLALIFILFVISLITGDAGETVNQIDNPPLTDLVDGEDSGKTGFADAEIPAGKAEYEALYANYLTDFKDIVVTLEQVPWSQSRSLDIEKDVVNSLELFNATDYQDANKKLRYAMEQAKALVSEKDKQVEKLVENLNLAFEQQSYKTVESSIEAIRLVDPDEKRLPEWQQRLSDLPHLIKASEGAQRARIENRPDDELEKLLIVDRLNPGLPDVTERIRQLKIMVRDDVYYSDVGKVRAALADNDVLTARKFLNRARSTNGGGEELAELTKRVDVLGREINANRYLKQAEHAGKSDDWKLARRYYASVLENLPENEQANQGFKFADKIVSAQQVFQTLLDDPLRLADENVSRYAKNQLDSASEVMAASQSLRDKGAVLSNYVALTSKKRTVLILSDGKSRIKVQGIGYIEPTRRRTVELKPGNYALFAERTGFRDKVVRLSVPLEGEVSPVSIMCDERI